VNLSRLDVLISSAQQDSLRHLSTLTNLEQVSINLMSARSGEFGSFLTPLSDLPKLTSFVFKSNYSVNLVALGLPKLTNLRSLNLDVEQSVRCINTINSLSNLTALSLLDSTPGDPVTIPLYYSRLTSNLEILHMPHLVIANELFVVKLTKLRKLCVYDFPSVLNALPQLSNLTSLKLSTCTSFLKTNINLNYPNVKLETELEVLQFPEQEQKKRDKSTESSEEGEDIDCSERENDNSENTNDFVDD